MTEQPSASRRLLAALELFQAIHGVADDTIRAYVEAQESQTPYVTEQEWRKEQEAPQTARDHIAEQVQAALDNLGERLGTLNDAWELEKAEQERQAAEARDQIIAFVKHEGLPPEGERDYDGVKADAEVAAAAIETLTAEIESKIAEELGDQKEEIATLQAEFTDEQDKMAGKLDKMRDKYFENHPDLAEDQRTDAENTFKTIKDDAINALKAQQAPRMTELLADQQHLLDTYEQAKQELDETRDERA